MMRFLRIAAVAAGAAFVVAACSSKDDTSSAPPANSSTASSSSTTASSPPATTDSSSSSSSSGGGGSSSPATGTIEIKDFQFNGGATLTVAPGATITVTNQDTAQHDADADDKSWQTDLLKQGESATFKAPTKPGTYKYSCTVHPNMTSIGTLIVK